MVAYSHLSFIQSLTSLAMVFEDYFVTVNVRVWPYRNLTVYHKRFSCHNVLFRAPALRFKYKNGCCTFNSVGNNTEPLGASDVFVIDTRTVCSECEPCLKTEDWRLWRCIESGNKLSSGVGERPSSILYLKFLFSVSPVFGNWRCLRLKLLTSQVNCSFCFFHLPSLLEIILSPCILCLSSGRLLD
jgi:hypothetical protein